MPGPYTMVYLLAFTLSTALIIHTIHGQTIYNGIKCVEVEEDDVHTKLMWAYPEVPGIWYARISLVFCVALVEIWSMDMPVWAPALLLVLPINYLLSCGFILAVTGQTTHINRLAEIIPGVLLNGRPPASMVRSFLPIFIISAFIKRWKTAN